MNIIEFIRSKVGEGQSQSSVARKCGISQALVNKMMYEDYSVKLETIRKIAAAYGKTVSDFINDPEINYLPVYGINTDPITGLPIHTQKIRLISSVSGGSGSGVCWESNEVDWIPRPPDLIDPEAFAMRVNGDSMVPKYTPGMIIYASPSAEIVNGDYIIAELANGERLVKRIRKTNGSTILESVNQQYGPITTGEYEIIKMAKITHSKEK